MPNPIVFPDQPGFIDGAADFIVDRATEAIAERGRFVIALSGGSTPRPIYARLSSADYRDRIDWSKVHVFFSDERCVPPDDSRSNYRMAREALLDHVALPADHIHRIQGEIDPAQAALSLRAGTATSISLLNFPERSISSVWAWATTATRPRSFRARPHCVRKIVGSCRSTSK